MQDELLYSFRESSQFTKRIAGLMSDDEYSVLQWYLQEHTEEGDIVVGGGGLRKLRWKAPGRGKRGGLRVIYYWADAHGYIYLVNVYAKNEKSDLSRQELQKLRVLVEEWLDE